ncbi:hypothetical protein BJV78DRAFT_751314 [Lactifluus subvellereus]|nr:hypothetical protein BJV78DRAFT_751314 [Lactifluus subvellereus]
MVTCLQVAYAFNFTFLGQQCFVQNTSNGPHMYVSSRTYSENSTSERVPRKHPSSVSLTKRKEILDSLEAHGVSLSWSCTFLTSTPTPRIIKSLQLAHIRLTRPPLLGLRLTSSGICRTAPGGGAQRDRSSHPTFLVTGPPPSPYGELVPQISRIICHSHPCRWMGLRFAVRDNLALA